MINLELRRSCEDDIKKVPRINGDFRTIFGIPLTNSVGVFSADAGGLLVFAAIFDVWTAPGGLQVLQVATVPCPPSPDVLEIHGRMAVILPPAGISTWLSGSQQAAAGLMKPPGAGMLRVEKVTDVDWAAP
ncbi:MAG: SOS response-associated peptidase family protein [Paracoccaceae bacterium]